jgi:hypothetical protein
MGVKPTQFSFYRMLKAFEWGNSIERGHCRSVAWLQFLNIVLFPPLNGIWNTATLSQEKETASKWWLTGCRWYLYFLVLISLFFYFPYFGKFCKSHIIIFVSEIFGFTVSTSQTSQWNNWLKNRRLSPSFHVSLD